MESRFRRNDKRRPGVLTATESNQFISSGTLSPALGVGLEGGDGCLEPGWPAVRRERDELVVDGGGRSGDAADMGGLGCVRMGALDRLPDLGQEFGIERAGPERVRQALRALAEQQPGGTDSVLAAEKYEVLEGPGELSPTGADSIGLGADSDALAVDRRHALYGDADRGAAAQGRARLRIERWHHMAAVEDLYISDQFRNFAVEFFDADA